MNKKLHMPPGVYPIREDSDTPFVPIAGYSVHPSGGASWERRYRVACSAEQVEPLMAAVARACLPETIYLILTSHWSGNRPVTYLSPFLPAREVQDAIEPYLSTLLQDGMVGFGLAWYDTRHHEEVFLDDHKEMTILTSRTQAMDDVLAQHGLMLNAELQFVSDHGHAHLNLGGLDGSYCDEIVRMLRMGIVPTSDEPEEH